MAKFCFVEGCRYNHTHTTSGHLCGTCKNYGHGKIECKNNNKISNLNIKYGGIILPKELRCSYEGCSTFWNHTNSGHKCQICNNINHNEINCNLLKLKITCPVCKQDNIINSSHIGIKGLDIKCCICLDANVNVYFSSCKHINCCIKCVKQLSNQFQNTGKTLNNYILTESNDTFNINFDEIKEKTRLIDDKIFIVVYVGMGCNTYIRRKNKNEPFELFFMHADSWGQYGINTDDRPYLELFIEDYRLYTVN